MSPRVDFAMIKTTFAAWNDDKAPRLAAAISYSTIFAIAPLVIITMAIAGAVLGFTGNPHPHTAIENAMLTQVSHAAGPQAADLMRAVVSASFGKPHAGIIAQIVGWLTFVIGASGVFMSLQDAMNTIWHVEPDKKSGIWRTIRDRVASLGMLLSIGFLLLVTLFFNAAIAFVSTHLQQLLPFAGASYVFMILDWLISIVIVTLLFALIFKVLPDTAISWTDVRLGALITAVLFVVGQAAIGWYITTAGVASAYGAAGGLLAILVWVYYSALILLLGAEFTKISAQEPAAEPPILRAA